MCAVQVPGNTDCKAYHCHRSDRLRMLSRSVILPVWYWLESPQRCQRQPPAEEQGVAVQAVWHVCAEAMHWSSGGRAKCAHFTLSADDVAGGLLRRAMQCAQFAHCMLRPSQRSFLCVLLPQYSEIFTYSLKSHTTV